MFSYIFFLKKKEGEAGQPIALSTVFGWVSMGKTLNTSKNKIITMYATMNSIDQTLRRFLEIEDIPTAIQNSSADFECKNIYQSITPC